MYRLRYMLWTSYQQRSQVVFVNIIELICADCRNMIYRLKDERDYCEDKLWYDQDDQELLLVGS